MTKKLDFFSVNLAGLLFACFLLAVSSCKTKKSPVQSSSCSTTPTYTADIKPILDQHCAATCHSAEKKKDGIDLSNYASSKVAAGERRFMGSLNHQAGYAAMPAKAPKLDAATLEKLQCWINGGLPE